MIILLILVALLTNADKTGITVGPDYCHIGVQTEPKAAAYALCYIPDKEGERGEIG